VQGETSMSGEILNPNHKKGLTEEQLKKSKIAGLMLVGAGVIATVFNFVGINQDKPAAEAPTNASEQTTEVQAINETGNVKEVYEYKNDITKLEAATIDQLSESDILNVNKLSQEDVAILGSFYLAQTIDAGTIYGWTEENEYLSVENFNKSQEPLKSGVDSKERGQALLNIGFAAGLTAQSSQGKEANVLMRYAYKTEVHNGIVVIAAQGAETIDQIDNLEKEGKGAIIKLTDQNKPKFMSFVEKIPNIVDSYGDTYSGDIVKYEINNNEMYALIAEPTKKYYDYRGEEIIIPKVMVEGYSAEDVKIYASDYIK